ncbi:DUF4344 domain-containing metallopeptidase [Mesorhizobium sp. BAC0120]|uniref:DUF4344 domain-containing metallopeptidase n=1 Tax=Mesorhizobium sp. BAC0120 TaxID=3090670 RepID=UPI00298C1BCE|nr:DUF4344 domain-containing metallopeptidase [Mesorhizobium sp. BAC0120]MDW6023719.1 DUF4344 domain-containing metallopeptidase [Mesorhizobium sp. BAC0120]
MYTKVLVGMVLTLVTLVGSETLATARAARVNRVTIDYVPPKNPAHRPIYEQLKDRNFLEKLQKFLSPIRLPRALLVKLDGCNGEADAFYDSDVITICYEYIDHLRNTMPAETTPAGVTPIDALEGPLFDTCLHEAAHALFDMLEVPVLGREEDAADQLSSFIILQLGKEEARRVIGGVAYAFKTEAAAKAPPTMTEFAGVHGTPAQRAYNVLCIAYGADHEFFGYIVDDGYLPKKRAEECEFEYEQVAYAYQKLISPYVDRRRAKKVLDTRWLRPQGK